MKHLVFFALMAPSLAMALPMLPGSNYPARGPKTCTDFSGTWEGSCRTSRTVTPWPYHGILVRFSVGLEAVADLQADIAQSLQRL